jgi:hypothetical protein
MTTPPIGCDRLLEGDMKEGESIVERKNKAGLILAASLGAIILAGFAGVSYTDEQTISQHPNDRANHHPVRPSVRENQAVTTQLGAHATAVSYWAATADGWHVVTTVDSVIADGTADERHATVRFSATLVDGQEQLVIVPGAVGAEQMALRIRRIGERIEMERVSDPSI